MHQRQRLSLTRVPRLVTGTLVALVPAVILVAAGDVNPVCFYLTPESLEWYIFWCWLVG